MTAASGGGFEVLRRRLDGLGYYQTLTPECQPLVEAILFDLEAARAALDVAKVRRKVTREEGKRKIFKCFKNIQMFSVQNPFFFCLSSIYRFYPLHLECFIAFQSRKLPKGP